MFLALTENIKEITNMQTEQNTIAVQKKVEQNPIHIDSKWFKEIIALVGSVEEAIILTDAILYHHNRYKSFKIGNDYLYGLVYSAKKYQKNLKITYRKAMNLPKRLAEKGWLEAHRKKLICNRTFYMPTKKALENIYKIHFSSSKFYRLKVKPVVQICTTGCADLHNPYKYKNKDKKYNNQNSQLKHYSLLRDSKLHNVKTVNFKFDKFNLDNIQCEASILNYFTINQSEVISTITFCYHDKLDIVKFNKILNQSDFKKEAKDFKQLVTWAYFEAIKKTNHSLAKNNSNLNKDFLIKTQNKSISLNKNKKLSLDLIDSNQKTIENGTQQPLSVKTYLSKMVKSYKQKIENIKDIEEKTKLITNSHSNYLMSQPNKLYLMEIVSAEGINNAKLILKTAENIIDENTNLNFNELIDGVIYRLVKLPKKQQQQQLINKEFPIMFESNCKNIIHAMNINKKNKSHFSKNNQKIIPNLFNKPLSLIIKNTPKGVADVIVLKNKSLEKTNKNKQGDIILNMFNKKNQKILIGFLNIVGIYNKRLIINPVEKIITKYPEFDFNKLLNLMIYRTIKLLENQQKHDISNLQLIRFSDLITSFMNKYVLRQDWENKADKNFYIAILSHFQRLSMETMIDYVKRRDIKIII